MYDNIYIGKILNYELKIGFKDLMLSTSHLYLLVDLPIHLHTYSFTNHLYIFSPVRLD